MAIHSNRQRLNPLDPNEGSVREGVLAYAYSFLGKYDEAWKSASRVLADMPESLIALQLGASTAALSGRLDEAHRIAARLRQADPTFSLSNNSRQFHMLERPEDIERQIEGLRLAGLPE